MDAKENGEQGITGYATECGCSHGLTKREHFAALAMQGMLARSYSVGEQEPPYDAMIAWSVRCADDLLRALSHSAGGEA